MRADAVTMRGRAEPKNASLAQTAKAVLCAFVGIRRGNEPGSVHLSPARIIAVAVICTIVLVLTLITVVKSVVG